QWPRWRGAVRPFLVPSSYRPFLRFSFVNLHLHRPCLIPKILKLQTALHYPQVGKTHIIFYVVCSFVHNVFLLPFHPYAPCPIKPAGVPVMSPKMAPCKWILLF